MWKCSKCSEKVEDGFDVCWNCGTSASGIEDPSFRRVDETETTAPGLPEDEEALTARPAAAAGVEPDRQQSLIVTTTSSIEGRCINRYCGVVTGETILGENTFKEFFAGVSDILEGRSFSYKNELRRARDCALAELEQAALELGANAIVGVDLDYQAFGNDGRLLMVSMSGTAVILE